MIVGFTVENFRSFRDETEVSFVSTARRDAPTHRLACPGTRHGVLPVLGVWGANASGKSNLLRAVGELKNLVEHSFTRLGAEAPIPWTPWRMRDDAEPTRIEVEFTVPAEESGAPVRHVLVVEWTAAGIAYEALYAWPLGTRRLLYERDADASPPFRPGRSLRQAGPAWQATRPNSLFLSAAAQFNHPQLLPVHRALTRGITVAAWDEAAPGSPFLFDPRSPLLQPENRPRLLKLMQAADLAVVDVELRPREDIRSALATMFRQAGEDGAKRAQRIEASPPPVELRLVHGPDETGETWTCPSELESDGTRKLLALLDTLLPVLDEGGLWVVDELDRSLHPDLCKAIVGLFTDPDTNSRGAQLLFATHSRDLLDGLRSDEVLLVDRDASGASRLTPASDYRRLRTRDSLQRAHRQGRIGGVPILAGLGAALSPGDDEARSSREHESPGRSPGLKARRR